MGKICICCIVVLTMAMALVGMPTLIRATEDLHCNHRTITAERHIPSMPHCWSHSLEHQRTHLGALKHTRFEGQLLGKRLWGRTELQSSFHAPSDLSRAQHFFRKLESGKAITGVGIGSSVVAECGGSWLPEGARERVTFTTHYQKPLADSIGYFGRFMQFINHTWPHEEHTFFNLGMPATGAESIIKACLAPLLPEELDLVVLEVEVVYPGKHPSTTIEKLLRKLSAWPGSPLVVFLNVGELCPDGAPTKDDGLGYTCWHCFADRSKCPPPVVAGTRLWSLPRRGIDAVIRPLAEAYAALEVSTAAFMAQMMSRHQPNTFDELRLLALSMAKDSTPHFRGPHGALAVADMLVNAVVAAWELLLPELLRPQPPAPQLPLPRAVNMSSREAELLSVARRCYGPATVPALMNFTVREEDAGICGSNGFRIEFRQRNTDLRDKFGWLATKPGSWILLEVDTTLPESLAHESDKYYAVFDLQYLASHKDMGRALLSCESGCSCAAVEVEAAIGERISINRDVQLAPVSSSASCRIRVTVLPQSSSIAHNFKIMSWSVTFEQPESDDTEQRSR